MNEIFVQYYGTLFADCMIIAIETIGLVKFFDNFVFPNRSLRLREKCGLEFIVCIICAIINSLWMPEAVTDICNLFLLALSLTQLCYDCIIHGVPKFIGKLFKLSDEESSNKDDDLGK